MSITTYSELKTAITNWTHRSDVSTVAADFIALAEAKFQRQIRHPKMQARAQATVSTGWVAIPDDFLELIHFEVEGIRLQNIAYNVLDNAYADNTGTPRWYAMIDEQFRIAPYTATDTVEIVYVQKIPVLSDSNTTNWLLTAHPDVYLHTALVEAGVYLQDDVIINRHAQLAVQAVAALKRDGARRRFGETGPQLTTDVPRGRYTFDINTGE